MVKYLYKLEKNHKPNLEKYKMKSNSKGFTLVEVLVAMSIISLIAMAFFTTLNSTIKANSANEKNIKCLNIAQSEIENIRQQIKESKPIQVESSESDEPIPIEINKKSQAIEEDQVIEKGIGNDNNVYYEVIKVEEKGIPQDSPNGYLYTINIIVNYDKEALILGKGKEITTQVFSTQNL